MGALCPGDTSGLRLLQSSFMPSDAQSADLQLRVLPFPEARAEVERHAAGLRAIGIERVNLLQADGRVLAQQITADRDIPPFNRATRDGFAVRAADLANVPATLKLAGEIRAGASPESSAIQIRAGECAEIMTGAPLPSGADAVVMVEYTARRGDQVEIQRTINSGDNYVPRAAEAAAGKSLLTSGTRIAPAVCAAAASVGLPELEVFCRPRIAILSTGDEIVPIASQPGPNQIRNSNSYSLAAQVVNAGGIPVILPIAADEPVALRKLIEQGLESDLLLMTGGVSMGKYDLVEIVLRELGAEFIFTGAHIQPGKPIVFGSVRGKCFFGLPGNPVSTMVTFELFARVIVEALSGQGPRPLRYLQARLRSDVKAKTGLTRFLPARLSGAFDQSAVELVHWQGSGDIVATAGADCLLVVPPDRELLPAGSMANVIPF